MHPRELQLSHLEIAFDLSGQELIYCSDHSHLFYKPTRQERKKNGKVRIIDEPKYEWKRRFKGLHRFFQSEFRPPRYCHGGVKRRSCFSSARRHLGRRFVLTRDIADCYPSITPVMLKQELRKLGFRSEIAALLSGILTVHGYVPQGNPVSNDTLNLFLSNVGARMVAECRKKNATYGTMCDDIVISCDSHSAINELGSLLERELKSLRLEVNQLKIIDHGIQSNRVIQKVHNIVVNRPGGVSIDSDAASQALIDAARMVRFARSVTPENLARLAKERERIKGHYCHFNQATFGPAKQIRRLIDHADRHVMRALEKVGLIAHEGKWWKYSEVERLSIEWAERKDARLAILR